MWAAPKGRFNWASGTRLSVSLTRSSASMSNWPLLGSTPRNMQLNMQLNAKQKPNGLVRLLSVLGTIIYLEYKNDFAVCRVLYIEESSVKNASRSAKPCSTVLPRCKSAGI